MLNNIYEERQRKEDGSYHMSLSIPRDDYLVVYGSQINDSNANDIVTQYLQYKEDDGRANNVMIFDYTDSDIINIEADINYTGNDHTNYRN
ncbi:MAG: hypothetical protein ACOCRK_03380 [bacterium]